MRNIAIKILIFIVLMSLMTACSDENQTSEIREIETETNNLVSQVSTGENENKISVQSQESTETYNRLISGEKVTVHYAGDSFQNSLFFAGGDILCVVGFRPETTSFFWGNMECEGDLFREADIGLQENMRAINMTIDDRNRCHILCTSAENSIVNGQLMSRLTFENSYILVITMDGEKEKMLDVSDIFAERAGRLNSFVVDGKGNYYFDSQSDIVKLEADGTLTEIIQCPGRIEGLGIGKSGTLYCTYTDEAVQEERLGCLVGHAFEYKATLPETKAKYVGVAAGTDTDIYLFNREDGVYAFDGSQAELRISGKELPVMGTEVAGFGFMGDGRLCLMEQDKGTVFYYIPIPAGK